MRRLAVPALVAVSLSLGCGPEPSPASAPWAPPLHPTTLHVAFDDIPVEKTKSLPMSLTSSEGAGLRLVSLTARAVLDDPLAFTELHLVFENPEDRVLEGNFSIVLPQGAAVSRFAMKNDLGYQEGEVVERQRARQAYEDFLHRRQDPALLEQSAGNEFSARVFPIPARGRKELIVSYQQELTPAAPYVLPLQGLPEIGAIDVEAYLAGRAAPVQRFVKQNVAPAADFRLETRLPSAHPALRNGEIIVARVAAVGGSQPDPLGSALILVDTSASRALGMVEEMRIAAELCAGMARTGGDRARVIVAAYDQLVEPIYEGPASGFGADALGRMRQRLALGASDLGAALAWAGREAPKLGVSRVVLVTDGIPNAGETTGDKLRAIAVGLAASGVERLDAVAVGGIRDDELLRSLANAGLAHGGVVIDGAKPAEETWRRLSEATRSGLEVKVEGAKFVSPKHVDGVQAGDEVIVYADVPEGQTARVSIGDGPSAALEPARAERPLIERAFIGARIRSLLEKERTGGPSDALSHEIVTLSTRFRVLSPKTALLVLERDSDYERFGIDRRALADILVADGGRVSLLARAAPQPVAKPVVLPPPPPRGGSTKKGSAPDRSAYRADAVSGGRSAPAKSVPADKPDNDGDGVPDRDGAPSASAAPPSEPPPPPPPPPQPQRVVVRPPSAPSPAAPPVSEAPRVQPSMEEARAPSPAPSPMPDAPPPVPLARLRSLLSGPSADLAPDADKPAEEDPYTGPFKTVMDLLTERRIEPAVHAAFEWRKSAPGDVMALVALGEGFEAAGDFAQAARCYGSIIDLFPARADLRRFAGERLERLPAPAGLDLALDTFAKARDERPDHPESHRLYAYALLRKGLLEQAFAAIVTGSHQRYPENRFAGVPRILAEDVGLIGAAWAKAEPARAQEILRRVRAEGGSVEDEPSIRFVLNWETDANDVDFHIFDADGGHAFYSQRTLASGGELYADVTTGYGPECFTIRGAPRQRRGPYKLQAHYFSRGPMGYGMGKLEIIEHDGKGGLTFEERPFVVMVDRGFVDLGSVKQ
jgi:Vault protein inter-alpha-trypsin domain